MNFKKVLAGVAAGSMVAAMAVVPAFAADYADGTAYLSINNSEWQDFEKTEVTAQITGNGTYTVSVTAAEPQQLAQFNALQIANGETVFGHEYVVTVDSIKVNGADYALQGASYTCSADGAGVDTRVNIYNEWNSADSLGVVDDKLGYADQRANTAEATAKLVGDDFLTDFTSIEVTFTVSGLAEDTTPSEDNSEETGDTAPVAYLAAVVALAGAALVASKKVRA
jgi:hypothetical protein